MQYRLVLLIGCLALTACSESANSPPTAGPQIATAAGATCVLDPGVGVNCRGNNTFGQVGPVSLGILVESFSPIPGTEDALDLAAGSGHFCARTPDEVLCWGDNSGGAFGSVVDPQGTCTVVVSHGGEVDVPCSRNPVSIAGPTDWLALGHSVTCVGEAGGSTACFGERPTIDDRTGLHPATAGGLGRCGVRKSGELFCVRDGPSPDEFAAASSVTAIEQMSISGTNICAITPDEELHCWGDRNSYGQLATGETRFAALWQTSRPIERARMVSMSARHACAADVLGDVWCWGANVRGQLGRPTVPVTGTEMVDPQTDVTPTACESTNCSPHPLQIAGIDNVVTVFALGDSSCAARSNGELWCWGAIVDTHTPTKFPMP